MTLNLEFQTSNLAKRRAYRFRYRAINKVGPSEWSPESFLVPAIKPEAPPQPSYVSSSDTEIVLAFGRSLDDGGSLILDYELQIDEGSLTSSFATEATYDFFTDGFSFAVQADDNSLTAGLYYRFRYRAKNALGDSEFSDI